MTSVRHGSALSSCRRSGAPYRAPSHLLGHGKVSSPIPLTTLVFFLSDSPPLPSALWTRRRQKAFFPPSFSFCFFGALPPLVSFSMQVYVSPLSWGEMVIGSLVTHLLISFFLSSAHCSTCSFLSSGQSSIGRPLPPEERLEPIA